MRDVPSDLHAAKGLGIALAISMAVAAVIIFAGCL